MLDEQPVLLVLPGVGDVQPVQLGVAAPPGVGDGRDDPDQVAAASNQAAQPNPDRRLDIDGLRAALTAPFEGSAIPYTAVFLFDPENKLRVVTLNPVGGIACPVIVQALAAHHGAPDDNADPASARTLRWDDADNDNLVVYADLGGGNCTIQYSRLPPTQPDGKGL